MSKYPVELSDGEGQVDAINYLLSGPAGLGQNFAGFSSDVDVYLTGTLRPPYVSVTTSSNRLAPNSVNLNTLPGVVPVYQVGDRMLGYLPVVPYFNLSLPPYNLPLGYPVTVTGVTPSDWNTTSLKANGYDIEPIGFIGFDLGLGSLNWFRTLNPIDPPLPAWVSGGTLSWTGRNRWLGTDCEVIATVTGPTDRVFINGQLQVTVAGANEVALARYKVVPNVDTAPPNFVYTERTELVVKNYNFATEALFLSVVDTPGPGTYRYIIEVRISSGNNVRIATRSISTQVVKE